MNRQSIFAIVAGVLVIVIVTTLADLALHAAGVFPPMDQPIDDRLSLLATSYRLVISIAGAWLTARLAPDRPMQHALILGVVGTILGAIGVVTTWNMGLGPRWYPIALAVLAIPQCWAGGRIYRDESAARNHEGHEGHEDRENEFLESLGFVAFVSFVVNVSEWRVLLSETRRAAGTSCPALPCAARGRGREAGAAGRCRSESCRR